MKKRLLKKKAKKLRLEMGERLKWVTGSNPVMMGSRLRDAVSRISAFEAQERSGVALQRLFFEGQATLIKGFGQNVEKTSFLRVDSRESGEHFKVLQRGS